MPNKSKTTDPQAQKQQDQGDDLAAKMRQAADKLDAEKSQPRAVGDHKGRFSDIFKQILAMLLAEFLKDDHEA